MTDLRLEDCPPPGDAWDITSPRSVERAEAIERATSLRLFLVRAVAHTLLAIDAGLLPARSRARRAGRGLRRVATLLALPVSLPKRGLARFVAAPQEPTVAEPVHPEPSGPELVPTGRAHSLGPAPSVQPVRRGSLPRPAPEVVERLTSRARALGTPATASAVLADLTWPARSLVPRHPVTAAAATLRRLPVVLAEARRAPATLAKVALAGSMTLTILGGSAAAAAHSGGGAGGVGGQVRSALPGTPGPALAGAHPEVAGKAPGHTALASSAGGSPGAAPLPPTTAAPSGPPVVPALRGELPPGKGMWLFEPQQVEGGNVAAIVAKSTATGLHYLYVHVGSSTGGFFGQSFLDQLLPAAHAAHIRVYGWDFPYFTPPEADVSRAVTEINYKTPTGDRIDGFAADIEPEPGVNLSAATAGNYSSGLRAAVGPAYPLIGVVPRPNGTGYPFGAVLSHFDAVAVMDYWLDREPGADIAGADATLGGQNVAMVPIGQAYNGAENGVPGSPSAAAISRFMQVAEQTGAVGVSFWSWQATTPEEWDAIRSAPQFSLPTAPTAMTPGQIRTWQVLLDSLGFPAWPTGVWDQSSVTAVSKYQRAAHLPVTGVVDDATKAVILTPFPPPIQPQQAPAPAPVAVPPAPAPTTTAPAKPSPLIPFLSSSQGMGTPTSSPAH